MEKARSVRVLLMFVERFPVWHEADPIAELAEFLSGRPGFRVNGGLLGSYFVVNTFETVHKTAVPPPRVALRGLVCNAERAGSCSGGNG